jgi:hypothetical protein
MQAGVTMYLKLGHGHFIQVFTNLLFIGIMSFGKNSIQQEEKSFHQQTGIKFKEETSKVLHLEHSSVWC